MLRLKINCTTRLPIRDFADKVSELLSHASVFQVSAKVSTTGRDLYKITWWYNDGLGAADFVAYMKDWENYENDSYDYDVSGLPIMQRDVVRDKAKIQPDAVMKQWEESGKFKVFCAMYGVKLVKPLYLTKKREELTGSNARAWERATGKKAISDNFMHFITGYFEQTVNQYQTADSDWAIKCVDSLLRYGRVFKDNKKVYIDDADREALNKALDGMLYNYGTIARKKNVFYIGTAGEWKSSPLQPLKSNPENGIRVLKSVLAKYYPDIAKSCTFAVEDGKVKITVT